VQSRVLVMRLWPILTPAAVLPFLVLACGAGWNEDANFKPVCVCGVGAPEEFAECLARGFPPDPETCPADAGTDGATDADTIGCFGTCAPNALLDLVSI